MRSSLRAHLGRWLVVLLAVTLSTGAAHADETITYTYNALGRLVAVSRAGTVNSGATESYTYDPAGNRQNVTVATSAVTLTLSPTSLPNGTIGTAYSQTITATGGTGPYTFAKTAGTFPAGLTLTSAGVLSGTPTTAATSSFTITATDSASHTGSQAYSVTTSSAVTLTLSPTSLPNGTVGTAYSQTITGSGGTSPYTYSKTAGTLPAGLSLNSSTGVLAGTPTTAATSSFTITANDSASHSGNRAYSVTIASGGTTTIQLATGSGVNLRTVANANGYTGSSSANYTFGVGSGVTVTGSAGGGIGIDTGSWPAGVTLALQVNGGGIVRGGGGNGGKGGGVSGSTFVSPIAGGAGGDAVTCSVNIAITVAGGGTVQAGGGGGGGGGLVGGASGSGPGGYSQVVPGSGGGGGAPNGAGGAGNTGYNAGTSTAGSPGTTSGGGAAGPDHVPGGAGGNYATAGFTGGSGQIRPGASGGAAGYAVRKNGTGCTVTNNGTVTGTAG